jgi:hypothetical protein
LSITCRRLLAVHRARERRKREEESEVVGERDFK